MMDKYSHQRAEGFPLTQRDEVFRTIGVDTGAAKLRSGATATGIRLIITKADKEHITVLSVEEAQRLAMLLLNQVAMHYYGRVL